MKAVLLRKFNNTAFFLKRNVKNICKNWRIVYNESKKQAGKEFIYEKQ